MSTTAVLALLVLAPRALTRHMELDPATRVGLAETLAAPLQVVRGTIERNATIASSVRDFLSPATVHALVETSRPVYDLARVSVGHRFDLTLEANGLFRAFTYAIDELRTLRVEREGESYKAHLDTRTFEAHVDTLAGTIESSLFAAVEDAVLARAAEAGAPESAAGFTPAARNDQVAIDLADVFAWDVDFNTEVQRGDSFRVVLEALHLDGSFVRHGRILGAEFKRGDRHVRAVYFDSASGSGYYTPEGTPLRRAFVRSPLKFSRISSRFTNRRFHPVLGVFRPHYGVDYAAPIGTPVHASGDGLVTLTGWLGGYGQTVKIRHANGYETLYGHLSSILVRRGQRVAQGALIGKVGRTGLATGPHLDYRMLRNGVYVDPLKVISPPAEPVRTAERPQFDQVASRALAWIENARAPGSTRTADAGR
jgi:murein DD-endopeptidase MepM/ murein hydrolase activator NlpD